MSIIITNVSDHDGSESVSEYVVRINNGPVLVRFEHNRWEGLDVCLLRAAAAVQEAYLPNPYERTVK